MSPEECIAQLDITSLECRTLLHCLSVTLAVSMGLCKDQEYALHARNRQ